MSEPIITIAGLSKTYKSGQVALHAVDLEIRRGEIFALLGPNGAGKTTLIGIVCGTVRPSAGTVTVAGHDHVRHYKQARARIGLVPQELTVEPFATVHNTVSYSRGLFGLAPDPARIEQILRDLSLWEKRGARVMELSGGMKRRVLIAKALAHEPEILFLDEPSAGVDVELRRGMWRLVRQLAERGTTIILTTHYIEEAQDMADRIGVIAQGRLVLVDDKAALMTKLGKRRLSVVLDRPLAALPPALAAWPLELEDGGRRLVYTFEASREETGMAPLLEALRDQGIAWHDLDTSKSTLEQIFVDLVEQAGLERKAAA
jgi:ABC-2 type transport system ATP-binding protein